MDVNYHLERSQESIATINEAMDYCVRTRNALDSERAMELIAGLLRVRDNLEDLQQELTNSLVENDASRSA